MDTTEALALIASLEGYLYALRDTGVDGLPLGTVAPAVADPSGAATQPSTPSSKSLKTPPAVATGADGQAEELDSVRLDIGDCRRCGLAAGRTNLVFGVGNPLARLVFVGEAPGWDEDQQGIPFVGEAGQLLTKIIQAMTFGRDEVYLCNVLKCHPPQNRNPRPDEIEQCHPFLLKQLRAIGPEVIVALGTFAAQTLLRTKEPISKLRGIFHDYHGIPLMPTFHPAYLLRNAGMKRYVWEDMQKVMKRLGMELPTK